MTGLEVHLSAWKQMLSIWDNPSITKVRRCAAGDGDVVFQLGDGDGEKKKKGFAFEIGSVACQLLRNGKCI